MSSGENEEAPVFSIGQRIGNFLTVEGSILSGTAVIVLLVYKLFLFLRRVSRRREHPKRESDACDSSLFLSLMTGELLRAIGGAMSLRWVLDGSITDDTFCVAQGYIKLIGTNAIDFSTLAITVQTFSILILRWNAPRHTAKFFTVGVWTVVLLITTICYGVHSKDLMGPTNFWCWIPKRYKLVQILSEYLWMWIIGISTAILYGLGYLVVSGYIVVDKGLHWRGQKGDKTYANGMVKNNSAEDKELRRMANQLLIYPLVYLLCIIPQSFSRWLYFSNHNVHDDFVLFATTLFSLSGLFNVILFFTTRYDLVAGASSDESIQGSDQDEPVFAHPDSYRTKEPTPRLLAVNVNKHGRLPHISEDEHPYEKHNLTTPTTAPAQTQDYSPYGEIERGRRILPQQAGSPSSDRQLSSSMQRSARSDEEEDEDYGRLPG